MNDNFRTIDNTATIHDVLPVNSRLLSVGKVTVKLSEFVNFVREIYFCLCTESNR